MEKRVILTLDMGGRVHGFDALHPSDNPAGIQLELHLTGLITAADSLGQKQRTGQLNIATGTERKKDKRKKITRKLTTLRNISRVAAAKDPSVTLHHRMPSGLRVREANFLILGRVSVQEATAQREIFLQHGMSPTLLDEITADLNDYQASVEQKRNGIGTSVGASAELAAIATEIMAVVRHMNVINQARFQDDPELLATWNSVRNVAWPNRQAGPTPSPDKKVA